MKTNMFKTTLLIPFLAACTTQPQAEWVSTTESSPWQVQGTVQSVTGSGSADVIIDPTRTAQVIDGFGTCFNELAWTSLSQLNTADRESILSEMFTPGKGANFTICRMPVGANDFAVDWYSYNETEGDFEMENFTIEHDQATLIPFIRNARQYNPDIRIWASPWSPPSWMKHNKHYASRSTSKMARILKERLQEGESTYMFKFVDNGLPEDREGAEGTDMFIVEEPYLSSYALYFSKFIEAYREQGIDIFGVMPQNEFNSDQIFPSCCWTAASLAEFVGNYLGPAMEAQGVEVMFGTMERPNELLVDTILNHPTAGKYVTALGFQWAGKDALPGLHKRYPAMKIYQTEQECGNGKNDWASAVHSWNLMKHYFNHGTNVYTYWNTSLLEGGISRWGWAQNSLVMVNEEEKTYRYTPEYYVMKHSSHYVKPGAKRIQVSGTYDDVLAFVNPDKSIVIVAGNNRETDKEVSFQVNNTIYKSLLKANSLNTLFIR
ncbi:MAG: beta-glycosidase [Tannerellaceae bacterium]|nr:beta-glycosidase [Tannerellaceae bacterium]